MKTRTASKKQSLWSKLEEATREFDKEFIADTFSPLTPEQQEKWERVRRKPAKGIRTISIGVERTLLKRSDMLARKKGLTREALIDRALKTVLAADGQNV